MNDRIWYVYMLRCSDDSLYTGITTNLDRRLMQHNAGIGAKYTRTRLPVRVVYYEEASGHSEALRREIQIKQLSRIEKLNLVK